MCTWELWESDKDSVAIGSEVFGAEGVTLIDSRTEEGAPGYIRRSQSPGGEAYSIFEFNRVSEDENHWVSNEAWIHVDQFDVQAAKAQYESLELDGQGEPTLWTLEEALELIAESTGG